MDVYTPYTLSFMMLITCCIIFSAGFNAYIVIKVRKTILFWEYIIIQALLLIWMSGKLLELVSPTIELMDIYIFLQKSVCILLLPAFLLFTAGLIRYSMGRKLMSGLIFVSFAILMSASYVCFGKNSFLSDFAAVFGFLVFNASFYLKRQSIFAELSEVSIDVFMEKLDDAVLIFDRDEKLIDFNKNAKALVHSLDNIETLKEFIEEVNKDLIAGEQIAAASNKCSKPVEIGVLGPSGEKYYIFNITMVENKKNMTVAVVLTFHDITEKTMLLIELGKKNAELDRLNTRLKDYISMANRLEEEREKNRAALEIQKTIGSSITELLMGLEVLRSIDSANEKTVREKLSETIDKCRSIMSEIRIAVEKLMTQTAERKEKP
jgi:signal transduction histidine kinase